MNQLKKTIIGAALALGVSTAQAVNVGGVVWDPDAASDFSSFSIAIRQFIDPITGVVSGFGFISTMNATGQAVFCPSGCEVTFTFGGFTPVVAGALPTTPGSSVGYIGGTVNVYVDSTAEITNPANTASLTAANTSDGNLWLSLAGHSFAGTTLTGFVLGAGGFVTSLLGTGLLDVTGGLAAANFDTNTLQDGADFSFTNSFTLFTPTNNLLDASGTGNFFSASIPEPGTLALAGLGLLGAGALRRRREQA